MWGQPPSADRRAPVLILAGAGFDSSVLQIFIVLQVLILGVPGFAFGWRGACALRSQHRNEFGFSAEVLAAIFLL
jgi:hypothetical protein